MFQLVSQQSPGEHGNSVKGDPECYFQGQVLKQATPGVFINMENLTLAHSDSYLRVPQIRHHTLMSLRTAPSHMSALFPDHIISKEE